MSTNGYKKYEFKISEFMGKGGGKENPTYLHGWCRNCTL